MADTMKSFYISSRRYSLDIMPPDDALGFGLRVARLIAPMAGGLQGLNLQEENREDKIFGIISSIATGFDAEKAEVLCKEALNYVITPTNEYLREPAVRMKWFAEHPEDIMAVPIRAVVELAKDFLLPMLTSFTQGLNLNANGLASTPLKNGK
jgi:hypothetical protein